MNNSTTDNSPVYSQAFAAAWLALLIWSGTTVANKIAVVYMDALSAGVLRSMLAGIIALIIALALRLPFPKSPRNAIVLLLSGTTSFAIWPALFSLGIGQTSAAHAALITALIPILTVLFAAILDNRKPRLGWWAGAAVALIGAITLIKVRSGSLNIVDDGSSATGDLIILSGCVTCSLGYIFGGKLSRHIGTLAVTFWGLAIALIILVPLFAAIEGRTAWSHVPSEGWLALAWMALLSSIAGYVLWFYALGRGGVSRIGSLQLAMPVMTLAAASVLLHEAMTTTLLSSGAAIVAGTLLAHRYAH